MSAGVARRAVVGAIVGALAVAARAPAALAEPLAIPVCTGDTGLDYWGSEALSGDLSLYIVAEAYSEFRVLAHCGSGRMVTVRPVSDAADLRHIDEGVRAMVASAQTFTFEDVRDAFAPPAFEATLTTIRPDGCLCANGN